jgi:hypothetical protein
MLTKQVVDLPRGTNEQRLMGADLELASQDVELFALALGQVGRAADSLSVSNKP